MRAARFFPATGSALALALGLSGGLAACSLAYGDKLANLEDEPSDGGVGVAAGGDGGDASVGAGGDASNGRGSADTGGSDSTIATASDGSPDVSPGCEGAACTCDAGACRQVIADNQSGPGALAVDGTNVYWVNENQAAWTVQQCPVTGCMGTPVHIANAMSTGLATDGTTVFATDFGAGTLLSCAVGGCNDAPHPLASGQASPEGPVVEGANLVWASAASGTIRSCAKAGCATVTDVATGQGTVVFMATESSYAVWSTDTGVAACSIATPCGTTPKVLGTSAVRSPVIVVEGTAYWFQLLPPNDGVIVACAVTGCGGSPRVVGTSASPASLASDGVNVYWHDDFELAIYKCPITGCNPGPETLVKGATITRVGGGMVVFGEWLYYTTDSSIERVHK